MVGRDEFRDPAPAETTIHARSLSYLLIVELEVTEIIKTNQELCDGAAHATRLRDSAPDASSAPNRDPVRISTDQNTQTGISLSNLDLLSPGEEAML